MLDSNVKGDRVHNTDPIYTKVILAEAAHALMDVVSYSSCTLKRYFIRNYIIIVDDGDDDATML